MTNTSQDPRNLAIFLVDRIASLRPLIILHGTKEQVAEFDYIVALACRETMRSIGKPEDTGDPQYKFTPEINPDY